MRELRGLVAEAVKRAAVRKKSLLYPRVRPLGDLAHLLERRRSERVELRQESINATVSEGTLYLEHGGVHHTMELKRLSLVEPVA